MPIMTLATGHSDGHDCPDHAGNAQPGKMIELGNEDSTKHSMDGLALKGGGARSMADLSFRKPA